MARGNQGQAIIRDDRHVKAFAVVGERGIGYETLDAGRPSRRPAATPVMKEMRAVKTAAYRCRGG